VPSKDVERGRQALERRPCGALTYSEHKNFPTPCISWPKRDTTPGTRLFQSWRGGRRCWRAPSTRRTWRICDDAAGARGSSDDGAGGAGGCAGGHFQRAGSGQHAVGVCDDGAGARGGGDEGAGRAGGGAGGHFQRAGSDKTRCGRIRRWVERKRVRRRMLDECAGACWTSARMTCAPNIKNCMSLSTEVSMAQRYRTLFRSCSSLLRTATNKIPYFLHGGEEGAGAAARRSRGIVAVRKQVRQY
jgi:hypothetical protein